MSETASTPCDTCAEGGFPRNECPESRRPCGHHCNCIWVHDHCHWCDAEMDEDGELIVPVVKAFPLVPALATAHNASEAQQ